MHRCMLRLIQALAGACNDPDTALLESGEVCFVILIQHRQAHGTLRQPGASRRARAPERRFVSHAWVAGLLAAT